TKVQSVSRAFPNFNLATPANGDALFKRSGRDALRVSEGIAYYKQIERREELAGEAFRTIKGHTFYKRGPVWVDGDYDETKMKAKARRITFGSDEYFTLVEEQPELQPFFALGEQVIVVINEQAYIVEAA
ncbi:MAG: hypothetical protein VCG02_00790, partial [Verrucomicrobiota bacterium]